MKFSTYLEQQTHEDRQAFIIHAPTLAGKTRFIRKACQNIPGLHYLDLLEHFISDPALSTSGKIDLEAFQSLLLGLDKTLPEKTTGLVIDGGDFIFNTWEAEEKKQFIEWLKVPLRTPSVARRTFIFVIQTDGVLSQSKLNNSRGQSRILALDEFEALQA